MPKNKENIWSFLEVLNRILSYFISLGFIWIGGNLIRSVILNYEKRSVFFMILLLIMAGLSFYFAISYIYKDFKKMTEYDKRKILEKQELLDDDFIK
jgi:hypothetical protein